MGYLSRYASTYYSVWHFYGAAPRSGKGEGEDTQDDELGSVLLDTLYAAPSSQLEKADEINAKSQILILVMISA